MRTVDVPIKDPKNPLKLTFPDRCVSCSKPTVPRKKIALDLSHGYRS